MNPREYQRMLMDTDRPKYNLYMRAFSKAWARAIHDKLPAFKAQKVAEEAAEAAMKEKGDE